MKQYADDTADFKLRAIETAWITDDLERALALSELFEDCGNAASVYRSPAEVAALFVHTVVETFSAEWMSQRRATA
ncbi:MULTISPECIES: hypothetical protein [unclassified Streptomyces]|uniref:hypothetical protein n=1 Tax=unclassified Streptomyces TaxID=2593676 RepID=UPI0012FF0E17|nr:MULTISPECIES: hypothetical protein [unclassified Streptomyces]